MAKKQLFAQLGVFLLLGVNVAAYWFLWPNYHSVSSNEGKAPTQEKGTTRLAPEVAPPKEIAPALLKDAVPLSIPVSAAQVESSGSQDKETLSKLFDHIKKDNVTTPPQVTLPLDSSPAFPPLHLQKEESKGLPTLPIAVASPLTPKMQPSPWLLSMEMVGTRTQLMAKMRRVGSGVVVAEFKILCDRVEMKAPGGELQALGKVNIIGAGLNATCQRLILPIHETRLVFEEQAQINHDGIAGSFLRGERIAWELPAVAMPSEFPPPGILPPALGLPK